MEILFFFGFIMIMMFFVGIYYLICLFYAWRTLKITKRYPVLATKLIQYHHGKKKGKNTSLNEFPKGPITASRMADVFSLSEIKYIKSFSDSYFIDWQKRLDQVVALNSEYPYAIEAARFGKFCFQPTGFNNAAEYNYVSYEEILSYSIKDLEKIISIPRNKLIEMNAYNKFVYDANYAFNIAYFQCDEVRQFAPKGDEEFKLKLELDPFENINFEPSLDFANIACKLHHVSKLYHFTDRSNIESIIRCGGLYSWSFLEEHNISSKKGGNSLSHSLDLKHGLQDYVRLSPKLSHPMEYRLEQNGYDLVTLEIHPIVLLMYGVLFSNKNATSTDVVVGSGAEYCDGVSKAAHLYFVERTSKNFGVAQSEVLVKRFLPIKYIMNIYDINI